MRAFHRLSPSCEELASAVGSLPGVMASMLCSLPLLCSELCARQWKQQAGTRAAAATAAAAAVTIAADTRHTGGKAAHANTLACKQAAAKEQKQTATGAVTQRPGRVADDAAGDETCGYRTQGQGSHTLKARNARLEVLLAASGALDLQVQRLHCTQSKGVRSTPSMLCSI
jgi:hypothetical protein